MTKRIHVQDCESPDGRRVEVAFMDDGTVHVILPAGQPWSILTHFSGPQGTRIRLAPVGIAAADVLEAESAPDS